MGPNNSFPEVFLFMRSEDQLWQLSFEELAHRCQQLGHDSASTADPGLREEARRIYGGWTDAFSIDKSEIDSRERFAAASASLRKRTIELLTRAEQEAHEQKAQ
jgi:hypothetical protein